ncbi:hypothetical protein [Glaciihabitans sp. UYNi722]|uniref:hypothetical protein n=1 Tax=Glaciihabitans sp. UYNi722 TaxID=3156344 RepID=UPI003393E068
MTETSVTRVTLADQRLPHPAQVHHVEVRRITITPSSRAGAHIHNGPVFGSIERGSVEFQIEDQLAVTLVAGDTFYEPAQTIIAKFDATEEGVTFLAYFLLDVEQKPEIEFTT